MANLKGNGLTLASCEIYATISNYCKYFSSFHKRLRHNNHTTLCAIQANMEKTTILQKQVLKNDYSH